MQKLITFTLLALLLVSGLAGFSCNSNAGPTPPAATSAAATPVTPVSPAVTQDDVARAGAANFIKNNTTFKFDGIAGSIKDIRVDPGWTSAVRSTAFTFTYQTAHPGHGDRSGLVLAQVITDHTAVILMNTDKNEVMMAICDKEWDMVHDKNPPMSVSGVIVGGGDTTPAGGPLDALRAFIYQIKKNDGSMVNVKYTAYPPSPVGDAARAKITLEFNNGAVSIGDKMEAYGTLDKATNTITVADQGDYIKTSPLIYNTVSVNVSWNIGETVVAATITCPEGPGLYPGIVFVPGSGPTDREWNSPLLPGSNGSARLLAEEFAKRGFVTIRYDKRFTGPNAQKNMPLLIGKLSMESHVEEIAGAVNQLLTRNVDVKRIYVVANSEGNIHAINYQLSRDIKFAGMILLAPPGRSMPEIMHTQLEAQLLPLPGGKEMVTAYDRQMADFLAGKPFQSDPVLPEPVNQMMQSLYAPVNLPFTRELFQTDLRTSIAKISVPTLVVIGKKDIQVDYKLDGAPLEQAVKDNNNFKFIYPDNANHILKYEAKPRENLTGADGINYNAVDRILDKDAVKAIFDWLLPIINK